MTVTSSLVFTGAAVGAASMTLSRSKLFLPLRFKVMRKSAFWGDLVTCWFCLAHWLAATAAALCGPLEVTSGHFKGLVNWAVTAMALVALAAPWVAIITLAMKQLGPHPQPDEVEED